MPGPTDQEQLFLELINEARIDPMVNAARYITSYTPLVSSDPDIQSAVDFFSVVGADLLAAYQALTPVAPLAWNGNLATAAQKHNVAMIAADEQSHQVAGELGLGDRIRAEGYTFTRAAENVYSYTESVIQGHAGFMIDWGNGPSGMQSPAGHRNNIMSANLSEVGISVTAENDPSTDVGPLVVTQDFGERNLNFVLGVAYSDNDHNRFYSIGEGRADLQVSWGSNSATSTSSGGYALAITAGLKTITLSGGGLSAAATVTTTIGADSIKLDVVDGNTLLTSGSVEVGGTAIAVIRGIGTLYGGLTLTAGAGSQKVIGTTGNDTLNGGDGDDVLEGGAGADAINGGNGNDVVVYAGNRSQYTAAALSGGSISLTGGDSGGDTLSNVEIFRFADGDFIWNAASGQLVSGTNAVPVAAASQTVSTNEDTAKQITVTATDGDGDTLTYTAGGAAHGSVTGGAGGVFTYTPTANYNGNDSFVVTVADGRGGTVNQTVNVSIAALNDTPVAAASQNVSTTTNTAKQITVTASDVDGDTLTYTAGAAAHGSIAGGAGGIFTYTPTSGYTGSDSFAVTVNDGHGGTANHLVNITVNATQPAPSETGFRLFAPDGFVGKIGGNGLVLGTGGFQDITLVDQPGLVRFDPSFNRGGDVIRLAGTAAAYTAAVSGSSLMLDDGDTSYAIPIGQVGTRLVFADGVRTLAVVGANVKLGSQTITGTAGQITAPNDGSLLPNGANPDASARLFLSSGSEVSVGGDQRVFGTSGSEKVTYLGGDLVLDPSFNRGGDELILPGAASTFSAYVSGSSVVLQSAGGTIAIPVGTTGLTLDFAGDERVLRFDQASSAIKIGNATISGNAANAVPLGGSVGGSPAGSTSLDLGSGSEVVTLNLPSNTAHVLADDAAKATNVQIRGFGADDRIRVTGATLSDYSFGSGDADHDGQFDDLIATFSGSAINIIAIIDGATAPGIVTNYASAKAVVGHDFMTFG